MLGNHRGAEATADPLWYSLAVSLLLPRPSLPLVAAGAFECIFPCKQDLSTPASKAFWTNEPMNLEEAIQKVWVLVGAEWVQVRVHPGGALARKPGWSA